jgi:hypothetical protein
MKIDQENFAQLVNKAMQVENVSHMRSVIEKELLHYDILFALEKVTVHRDCVDNNNSCGIG